MAAERDREIRRAIWRLNASTASRVEILHGGVWLLAALAVGVVVVLPLYHLVVASLTGQAGITFDNFVRIFSGARFREAMVNSLALGALSSALSMLIGVPMAWFVSRSDMPLRRTLRICVLGSFAVPAFVNALSWVLLAGPNAGSLNKAWMVLTGADSGLFNIFSLPGLVLVYVATIYPLAFIFMHNAFESMDMQMEHAARLLGASTLRAVLTVTLPLARPALIAGFVMTFLEAVALYGAPAVIGVPARIYVVTTQIWSLFQYPPQVGMAAALALPLALVTVALLWIQRALLGRRGYGTIHGKAGRMERTALGLWRWPAACIAIFVVLITFVLPNAVLIFKSFYAESYQALSLSNLTLEHYRYVLFEYIDGLPSIRNSLVTSSVAATLGALLALIAAFIVRRGRSRLAPLLGFLCVLPLVIPSMVFAVALVATYSGGWIVLYGTLSILVLAFVTKNLPYAYMTCSTSLASVHVELESAARVLGASALRVLKDVTGPLARNGVLTGWIVVFANSLRELSASVLLYTSKTTVIATAIIDVYYASDWGSMAALSVILLAINAIVIAAGYRLFGRSVINATR